jgi:peptide chain release factor 2
MLTQTHLDEFTLEVNHLISTLDEHKLIKELEGITEEVSNPAVWEDTEKSINLNKRKSHLETKLSEIKKLKTDLQDLQAAHDLGEEGEFENSFLEAKNFFTDLENQTFMNGKFDDHGAMVSIHAGAGGVDAMDFASMLMSMYQAFAKTHGFDCKVLHISAGDEAGLKSATFEISGINAYGHMKEESGVHRLVRLSPFNNGNTRETSFALVEVVPTNIHSEMSLENIDEKDLKWDYFMSSGKGGQSVNTTYSAVRLTHIPTGISVSCQNERNQLQNKQQALMVLHDKLAVIELQKQKDMESELKGVHISPEWGSQIRNYVLHPYKKIKDVRSGWETNTPDDLLLNGELLEVMWSVKRARKKSTQ